MLQKRISRFRRVISIFGATSVAAIVMSASALAADYKEAPVLAELVAAGKLPPVAERLPADPLVITPYESIGTYGGTMRVMHSATENFGDAASVVGHETILKLAADDGYTIEPNLAESWSWSDDNKTLSLTLRAGLRWSDGAPFTTDDILFWYDEILQNKELVPSVPSVWMPGGELMKVTKVDDRTFEMSFATPYRFVEVQLARYGLQWADNSGMFVPAHFLKQFHPNFTDPDKLTADAKAAGYGTWVEYFMRKAAADDVFGVQNFEAPIMRAFMPTGTSSGRTTLERNPYYWKVDTEGNQLPYADRVDLTLVQNAEVYALKASSGEVDIAIENTSISQMPAYLQNAEAAGYRVLDYQTAMGSLADLMLNMTHKDPDMRALFQDFRFRQALSVAMDRDEMNELIFFGLGTPMNPIIGRPGGRCWDEAIAKKYIGFDQAEANRLLDEIGMKYDGDYRTLPNGKPFRFTLTFWPGEGGEPKRRITQLAQAAWKAVGLNVDVREVERSLYWELTTANDHDMALWHADSLSDPLWMVNPKIIPARQRYAAFATAWAQWIETNGTAGEEPPAEFTDAIDLWLETKETATDETLTHACRTINQMHVDNLWTIGTIGLFPQPVIASAELRNLPDEGSASWDWGYLARYHPEQFYLAK